MYRKYSYADDSENQERYPSTPYSVVTNIKIFQVIVLIKQLKVEI